MADRTHLGFCCAARPLLVYGLGIGLLEGVRARLDSGSCCTHGGGWTEHAKGWRLCEGVQLLQWMVHHGV